MRGWWCAGCERPLVTVTSVFREGRLYVCGRCEGHLPDAHAHRDALSGALPGDEYLYLD